jgi:hypothetical protein
MLMLGFFVARDRLSQLQYEQQLATDPLSAFMNNPPCFP